MDNLAKLLSTLSPSAKAIFLARVIHEATISARFSYIATPEHPQRTFEHPDPIILRDANNFVHRMSGLIRDALTGKEWAPDNTIIEMIQEHFHGAGQNLPLAKWLSDQH